MSTEGNTALVEELYAAAEVARKAGDRELEKQLEQMAELREDPCWQAAASVREQVRVLDTILYDGVRNREDRDKLNLLRDRLVKVAQDLSESVRVG